ncbi:MAG: ribonuclease P protein component [bacterium]
MDGRFRKQERLRKKEEIGSVLQQHRISGKLFTLYYCPNHAGYSRLGLIVSRVVGKAVIRNRVKRRLREVFRHSRRYLNKSLDIVIRAKASSRDASYHELKMEYFNLLKNRDLAGSPGSPNRKSEDSTEPD